MTLRRYRIAMNAAGRRIRAEHKDRAWSAWQTARLGRMDGKKFPTLDAFLKPIGRAVAKAATGPRPWQELYVSFRAWSARAETAAAKKAEATARRAASPIRKANVKPRGSKESDDGLGSDRRAKGNSRG